MEIINFRDINRELESLKLAAKRVLAYVKNNYTKDFEKDIYRIKETAKKIIEHESVSFKDKKDFLNMYQKYNLKGNIIKEIGLIEAVPKKTEAASSEFDCYYEYLANMTSEEYDFIKEIYKIGSMADKAYKKLHTNNGNKFVKSSQKDIDITNINAAEENFTMLMEGLPEYLQGNLNKDFKQDFAEIIQASKAIVEQESPSVKEYIAFINIYGKYDWNPQIEEKFENIDNCAEFIQILAYDGDFGISDETLSLLNTYKSLLVENAEAQEFVTSLSKTAPLVIQAKQKIDFKNKSNKETTKKSLSPFLVLKGKKA